MAHEGNGTTLPEINEQEQTHEQTKPWAQAMRWAELLEAPSLATFRVAKSNSGPYLKMYVALFFGEVVWLLQ